MRSRWDSHRQGRRDSEVGAAVRGVTGSLTSSSVIVQQPVQPSSGWPSGGTSAESPLAARGKVLAGLVTLTDAAIMLREQVTSREAARIANFDYSP